VKALQMIRTVEFSQMLYTIDDVTKYRGILISRYFLSLDTVYRRTFLNTAHPYTHRNTGTQEGYWTKATRPIYPDLDCRCGVENTSFRVDEP